MKKIYYALSIGVIGILSFTIYHFGKAEIPKSTNIPNQIETKKSSVTEQSAIKDEIPTDWQTYTNDRIGISFQYPTSWTKNGDDANISDRTGAVVAININFIEAKSQTTFSIEYHFAPKEAELYKYAESQFNSRQGLYAKDAKQIEVAGNKAIEAFTTIRTDGKGNALNQGLRLILVDFLDKSQTGSIRLEFKTPLTDGDSEVAKFNQLLSTFKFTK